MPGKRVVIVGGVAGGATTAARMMRLDNTLDITVLEKGNDVSFANCGLPYHIGGEIRNRGDLLLHTPTSLRKVLGVTSVKIHTEVVRIDREKKCVYAKKVGIQTLNATTTALEEYAYDVLILSPGANPIVPPIPGLRPLMERTVRGNKAARIFTLRTMADMDLIFKMTHKKTFGKLAIVGAGFIGVELAEQVAHGLKKEVVLIEKGPTVIPQADPEMSTFLHGALRAGGVELLLGDGLKKVEENMHDANQEDHEFHTADGVDNLRGVTLHLDSGRSVDVDGVVLCIGVRAETKIAKDAGISVNPRGLMIVNQYMQAENDPSVYCMGDAVETRDSVFPEKCTWIALGNVANMQARVAADHAVHCLNRPGEALPKSVMPYPGSQGTSIVRAFDTVLALTGWNEKCLLREKIPHKTSIVNAVNHAGYYPNAEVMAVKITFCPSTGRILGGQVAGKEGVDKRCDIIATAIQGKLSIFELGFGQFSYAPPFGAAKDPINLVCLNARNIMDGNLIPCDTVPEDRIIIDVRPRALAQRDPLRIPVNPNDPKSAMRKVKHIYFADMPRRVTSLATGKKYVTICAWGRTSYFAHRVMRQAGLDCCTVQGGQRVLENRYEKFCLANPSGKKVSKL